LLVGKADIAVFSRSTQEGDPDAEKTRSSYRSLLLDGSLSEWSADPTLPMDSEK
jgi:hypothetical protein